MNFPTFIMPNEWTKEREDLALSMEVITMIKLAVEWSMHVPWQEEMAKYIAGDEMIMESLLPRVESLSTWVPLWRFNFDHHFIHLNIILSHT